MNVKDEIDKEINLRLLGSSYFQRYPDFDITKVAKGIIFFK